MGWSAQSRVRARQVERGPSEERRGQNTTAPHPPKEAGKRRLSKFRPSQLPPGWALSLMGFGSEELVWAMCHPGAEEAAVF